MAVESVVTSRAYSHVSVEVLVRDGALVVRAGVAEYPSTCSTETHSDTSQDGDS